MQFYKPNRPILPIILTLVLLILPCIVSSQAIILVCFESNTGTTKSMAEAVANGARAVPGAEVVLLHIDSVTTNDLLEAHAIIVGSPVHNAGMTASVRSFINSWPFEGSPMKDKVGAAFVTAGGISAGEELVLMDILQSMLIFNMIIVGGNGWNSAFGASGIKGEPPFDTGDYLAGQFLRKGEELGKRVAEITLKLHSN